MNEEHKKTTKELMNVLLKANDDFLLSIREKANLNELIAIILSAYMSALFTNLMEIAESTKNPLAKKEMLMLIEEINRAIYQSNHVSHIEKNFPTSNHH